MTAIVPALIGMVLIAVGYFVYSKFIAEKIYQLDPNFETPAHSMRDDVDFTPTNRVVLWGHHFTSVAGAAPSSDLPSRSSGGGCLRSYG